MPPDNHLRFYTSEQLGAHQALTPDGFLLCSDVPVARTGVLLYSAGEVPVDANSDGIIRIMREPEEVFSPMSMASFAGKPVTNDHPPEKVSPENWKAYSIGVCLNPRRGDGLMYDNEFLYADLLITDSDAIQDVREGKREVSAGYDADYEQIRQGEGRQHLIVGNHVALVDKGRCGPRCSIGDEEMATVRKRPAWFDRVMQAHKTGDEERLVDTLEKVTDMLGETWLGEASGRIKQGDATDGARSRDEMHIHLHQGGGSDEADPTDTPAGGAEAGGGAAAELAKGSEGGEGGGGMEEILQRLAALERAVAILAQSDEGEGDPAKEEDPTAGGAQETAEEGSDWSGDAKTKDKTTKDATRAAVGDSTSMRGAWQELISRAEVLAPGIRQPTFDAKQPAKTTFDTMCQFRRKALSEALKEDDTRAAVEQVVGNKKTILTQMSCDAVGLVFNGASELVRQANTHRTSQPTDGLNYNSSALGLEDTVKMINQRNREQYGRRA